RALPRAGPGGPSLSPTCGQPCGYVVTPACEQLAPGLWTGLRTDGGRTDPSWGEPAPGDDPRCGRPHPVPTRPRRTTASRTRHTQPRRRVDQPGPVLSTGSTAPMTTTRYLLLLDPSPVPRTPGRRPAGHGWPAGTARLVSSCTPHPVP